ncbi:uncharacterized protein LOC132798363 [Drosophila nasuta]|uniref:uncharacterized protein LOC132798363 n=1 Tax=Drosophila nasuta TaxID=42062 RepID=UPI00295F3FAB|nr:uncharacterized protein LOC132798363 [Drosophila nasuta]XP_060666165.1 uncharacterized protein LOC132798363 [Drosophila nasuta]XP_060666166.1 uncharacterized protein LOC132798363 [Drosophila nasuta]
MEHVNTSTQAGMSAQTSAEGVTATIGGHGRESVVSGHTTEVLGVGYLSCNNTPTNNDLRFMRAGTDVLVDSDQESVASISSAVEERLLRSPRPIASTSKVAKRGTLGLKEKAKYKAAVRIQARFGGRANLSVQDKEKLAWADAYLRDNRTNFLKITQMRSGFTVAANPKVESMTSKRQRSAESPKQGAPVRKKQRPPGPPKPEQNTDNIPRQNPRATVSETARRHLAVALIDRGDSNGKMSADRWQLTHAKLVDALFVRMENAPDSPMPTFKGAGWLNGVKILTCKDVPTLLWLKKTVPKLDGLWEGANLDVVDRNSIPSMPKAKVLFPVVVQGERALQLLKKQNPAIPTTDWSVLKIDEPLPNNGGQHIILQINKEAEDMLYKRNGKMAWGVGSVYLRLKKTSSY